MVVLYGNQDNPIGRNVLYNTKERGGINLIDNFKKAKSIFCAIVIKLFVNSTDTDIMKCFMANEI